MVGLVIVSLLFVSIYEENLGWRDATVFFFFFFSLLRVFFIPLLFFSPLLLFFARLRMRRSM